MASMTRAEALASNGGDGTLLEWVRRFGTEEACEEELLRRMYPGGFACPARGHTRCAPVSGRPRKWQCTRCSRQFSVTAGTCMRGTKLPLTKWFLAVYLMTHSKRGVSAMELARQLGVSERTAGYVVLRLRGAMAGSESVQAARRGRGGRRDVPGRDRAGQGRPRVREGAAARGRRARRP